MTDLIPIEQTFPKTLVVREEAAKEQVQVKEETKIDPSVATTTVVDVSPAESVMDSLVVEPVEEPKPKPKSRRGRKPRKDKGKKILKSSPLETSPKKDDSFANNVEKAAEAEVEREVKEVEIFPSTEEPASEAKNDWLNEFGF